MTDLSETEDFHALFMAAPGGAIVDDLGRIEMAALQEMTRSLSSSLSTAGLGANEPVLIPVSGRAEDVAAIMGVVGAGGTAVPFARKSHADARRHLIDATGARFQVGASGGTHQVPDIEIANDSIPAFRPLLDGAAMITFTSGSTGQPKGVVLARDKVSAKYASIREAIGMTGKPVVAVPLQLQFSFGQWATFLPLSLGGTVHMTSRFTPAWIENLVALRCLTHLAAVPTMLRMLVDGPADSLPLSILTGGEAISEQLRRNLFARFPNAIVHSIYGLTETNTCDLFRTDDAETPASEHLGFPGPGIEVATNPETLELMIRSPFCMKGYIDDPAATGEALHDGWIHTGDMAEIGPDGSVVLKGRIKELINRGGNKVSPLEVEATFANHPDVQAVLATGVPDARIGEAIHLFVVPRETTRPTPENLLSWAHGRTDRFKLPDAIHFGSVLPLGATGKADRAALKRAIVEGVVT
ncbi:class I adenylate-forming enzyme family protein [Sediminimonas qiaohouensis]|uniref:class I adenylate-forming enzyme family protein n=1 Tax=Sediminimonas qiaohouensis TaxID=552061 RepID=UPI0004247028|nr:fatty acid--CoA ligase family protein [Sediminimonas qiaohouensis]